METGTAAAIGLAGMLVSGVAFAWGGLQSQSINEFSRYCTYTDGGVLTVGATDLCPITNQADSGAGDYPNINIENRSGGFGSLTRQAVNGFNRYCFYSHKTVLTVGATDLCPLTDQ
jgi:hypothetical protein